MSTLNNSETCKIAIAFANALVAGDFAVAHSMLGTELGKAVQPDSLRQSYESMIDYGGSPISGVELMESLEAWPGKKPSDLGWAYVALSGEGYSEAVAVVVAQEHGAPVIREIEWGRP